MKKLFPSFLFILLSLHAFGQHSDRVKISFAVVLKNSPIILHDSMYQLENGNDVKFEMLKFYISNIQLLQNNVTVFTAPNSFYLIDVSDTTSQNIFLNLNQETAFNQVRFNLGIDSTTNVGGAMGGDLDPTKGMYWTWQSGYINFKMEGTCNICPAPKHNFEFHLGGYQHPFNSLQKIELHTTTKNNCRIVLDIHKFFTAIDLAKQAPIMSACAEAVTLSQYLANCFSIP